MNRTITKSEIYKVEFFEPVNGKTEYYYGSLKAIFTEFEPEAIGCSLSRLYSYGITAENAKVTNRCIIRRVPVGRLQREKTE